MLAGIYEGDDTLLMSAKNPGRGQIDAEPAAFILPVQSISPHMANHASQNSAPISYALTDTALTIILQNDQVMIPRNGHLISICNEHFQKLAGAGEVLLGFLVENGVVETTPDANATLRQYTEDFIDYQNGGLTSYGCMFRMYPAIDREADMHRERVALQKGKQDADGTNAPVAGAIPTQEHKADLSNETRPLAVKPADRPFADVEPSIAGVYEPRDKLFGTRLSVYPSPLGMAAFHGLAGEIVRTIEPHTEADPAALLFQLLAAFGNIIGRGSYIVADGAKHCLNLFGVLVGQSSKGRKGTSWNQIGRLLGRVDADWLSKQVTSGLSTGEGLIWNVRDSILITRTNAEGECEQVEIDPGVPDKRLFLLEGEFANLLQVMERGSNTLSPIVRQAWDSGALRTMTKNSPAKATNAHIAIIGHITRVELRRLLNHSEAANGFANRFCWLAVKRSKCLPEGGQIDTVNFDSFVRRLKSAIEFSRNAGQVNRGVEASVLWRAIYPELSEGKPGMLGAVTGRAEAQVMRLSVIYALLDESSVIEPAHHHAAMALWNYCEQSASWIFGTITGDKNADKIIASLRDAGAGGLTRTEISERVFSRNLSRYALDDALQTLYQSGFTNLTKEATAGAPSERWFAAEATK